MWNAYDIEYSNSTKYEYRSRFASLLSVIYDFTHVVQDHLIGTGAIIRMSLCQWSIAIIENIANKTLCMICYVWYRLYPGIHCNPNFAKFRASIKSIPVSIFFKFCISITAAVYANFQNGWTTEKKSCDKWSFSIFSFKMIRKDPLYCNGPQWPPLLTWFNFNPSMNKWSHTPVTCGMKLRIHS